MKTTARTIAQAAALAACLFAAPVLAQTHTIPDDAPLTVPGEYLVTLAEGADVQSLRAQFDGPTALTADALRAAEPLPLVNAVLVRIDEEAPGVSGIDVAETLQALEGVAAVQSNFVYYVVQAPDDPRYPDQGHFDPINAEAAWGTVRESADTVIAIIDTGIDYNHPDLSGNMWQNPGEVPNNNVDDDGNGFVDDVYGVNVVDPASPSGDPMDGHSHGTHVAGIAAAFTDNALDVAGVTWRARLMAVKFLSDSGSGSTAGAIEAINYAVAMGADIMNNSWGGGGEDALLRQAIQVASDRGILFVAAAGNAGADVDARPFYPCAYEPASVLCVMATDDTDAIPSWTNHGATTVDIAAPGVSVLATTPGGNVGRKSGTSMASPVVAGAAALLHGQDDTRGQAELKQIILDTAETLPNLSGRNATGGRLDLAAAVSPGASGCTGNALLAYDEFYWSERKSFSSNSNILSVDFTLDKPTPVLIRAQGSADLASGSGPRVFRTGVYTGASTGVMWTGSYRRGTLEAAQRPVPVSTQFGITLPAGSHTMYWKLWLSRFTMDFDSASLSVLAVPCSMGGKLSGAGAAAAPVTRASP